MLNHTTSPDSCCTLLLLSNLLQPEWIPINCTEPHLFHVICQKGLKATHQSDPRDLLYFCSIGQFAQNRTCNQMHWYFRTQTRDVKFSAKICKASRLITQATEILHLLNAVDQAISPLLLDTDPENKIVKIFVYNAQTDIMLSLSSQEFVLEQNLQGFYACQGKPAEVQSNENLFSCEDGSYISISSVCNGKPDCAEENAADEAHCNCSQDHLHKEHSTLCMYSSENNTHCSTHYFMDKHRKCVSFLAERDLTDPLCSVNQLKHCSKTRSHHLDFLSSSACKEHGQLQCQSMMSMSCFRVVDICIYRVFGRIAISPMFWG